MNVSLLDFSKAYDNVHPATLFQRLLDVALPGGVVKLLARWHDRTYAYVRLGPCLHALILLLVCDRVQFYLHFYLMFMLTV